MSCPSWQWHRTGSSWSPVRTLPVAPLWCDLGFVQNSRGNKAALNLHPEFWVPRFEMQLAAAATVVASGTDSSSHAALVAGNAVTLQLQLRHESGQGQGRTSPGLR